jgi:hypothetical protein
MMSLRVISMILLLASLPLTLASLGQVSRIEPNNGQSSTGYCWVTANYAWIQPTGNYGSTSFRCSGGFPGRLTAGFYLESTTAPATIDAYGRVTAGMVYDSVVLTWPRTVRNCSLGICGPSYVEEIPSSYSMSTSAPTWIGTAWRVRTVVQYDATVCFTECRSILRKTSATADPLWTY